MNYTSEQLQAIYQLGKLYLELGYFTPAERILSGLIEIDKEMETPALLAVGVLKIEKNNIEEALLNFRSLLQVSKYSLEAKLGICACFISLKELSRARLLLIEVERNEKKKRAKK